MANTDLDDLGRPAAGWRLRLYRVIYESDTRAGRLFDQLIVAAILVSVAVVIADSVQAWHLRHSTTFAIAEWFFTLLFTVEYIARLITVDRPLRYARSFFGIVDLVAVLPTYLALFLPELHALIDVRILRLLRIFRIFRLTEYVAEYQMLGEALKASRRKILVFLSAVLMVALILGTLLYVVEGPEHGFTDIPTAVYWAITTITTVGFGDITPKTDFGRLIASVIMLIGWGTLAVPTGIVTAEMTVRRHARAPLLPGPVRNAGRKAMGPRRISASSAAAGCPRSCRVRPRCHPRLRRRSRPSIDRCSALRQQFAQHRAMAVVLVLAVAAQGESGLVRQRCQQIQQMAGLGLLHFTVEFALERGP